MHPQDFIIAYELALNSQDWKMVDPLFHEKVCVTFSNGQVHEGKAAVKHAFEKNFSLIKSEKYNVKNVRWILQTDSMAAYLFEYFWEGIIDGKLIIGNGIGTSVLVNENSQWILLTENLSKKPSMN